MRPFLLALATLALLVSCAPVHEVDDGRIDIIASSFPAYDAARAIVGEDAKLSMLLPVGSDSHSYEPSAEDAVRIAEADLKLRGPGDLEGTQQSGMAFDLKIANIAKDGQLIQLAREEAQKIVDDDPTCQKNEYSMLWRRLDALRKNNVYFGAIS